MQAVQFVHPPVQTVHVQSEHPAPQVGVQVQSVLQTESLTAAQRAIDKRAPFHRQRNGIDDAVPSGVWLELKVA